MKSSFSEHLQRARASRSALLAFNVVDLATVSAVLSAAKQSGVPVIVQYSSRTVKFYGADVLVASSRAAATRLGVPAFVHLDHCREDEVLAAALAAGFDGVMADGSHLSLDENIRWTRMWRDHSRKAGALLEAEFTSIRGEEDGIGSGTGNAPFALAEYKRFCLETQPDFAGADIGTHHGHYESAPTIDFDVLRSAATPDLPAFVVHGGSGLSAEALRQLLRLGTAKINFSTDLKDAWLKGMNLQDEQEPLERIRRASAEVEATVRSKFDAVARANS